MRSCIVVLCLLLHAHEHHQAPCFEDGEQCSWCHTHSAVLTCGRIPLSTAAPDTVAPVSMEPEVENATSAPPTLAPEVVLSIIPLGECSFGEVKVLQCPRSDRKCLIQSSPWSACTAECGGGRQARNITAIADVVHAGATTLAEGCLVEEEVACNRRPCAIEGDNVEESVARMVKVTEMGLPEGMVLDLRASGVVAAVQVAALANNGLKVVHSSGGKVYVHHLNTANQGWNYTIDNQRGVKGVSESAVLTSDEANMLILSRFSSGGVRSQTVDANYVVPADATSSANVAENDAHQVFGVFSSADDPNAGTQRSFEQYFSLDSTGTLASPAKASEWCAPGSDQRMVYHSVLEGGMFVSACATTTGGICTNHVCTDHVTTFLLLASGSLDTLLSGAPRTALPYAVTVSTTTVRPELGALVATPTGVLLAMTDDTPTACPNTASGNVPNRLQIYKVEYQKGGWGATRLALSFPTDCTHKRYVRAARFEDGFLLGWGTDGGQFFLGRLHLGNDSRYSLGRVEEVTSWAVWGQGTNWVTTTEGEVAWAHGWDIAWRTLLEVPKEGVGRVKVVRIAPSFADAISVDPLLRCQGQATCFEAHSIQHHEVPETGSSTWVIVGVIVGLVALIAIAWYVYNRRSRVVGSRAGVAQLYPWESQDVKSVEYVELPKQCTQEETAKGGEVEM